MDSRKLHRWLPLLAIPLTADYAMGHIEQTIWFFGNSYTDQQGLIGFAQCWYEKYAQNTLNISHVETPRHIVGDATLGSHVDYLQEDPEAPFFMDGKDYPWVVLQEQSLYPSVPELLESSVEWARALSFYFWLHQVHDVMFLMTWGRRDGFTGLDVSYPDFLSHNRALLDGYSEIVEKTSTPSLPRYMAPCGLTFETIYNDCVDRGVDPLDEVECLFPRLYATDGGHPSRLGAYACGATIAAAMTGADPVPHTCYPTTDEPIYESEGIIVRQAVAKTIRDTFNSGLIKYPFDTLWPTPSPTNSPTVATEPPTEAPSTRAPTQPPSTTAPTESPSTKVPTQPPSTRAPTEPPSTKSPTEPPLTTAPTELLSTQSPTEAPFSNRTQLPMTAEPMVPITATTDITDAPVTISSTISSTPAITNNTTTSMTVMAVDRAPSDPISSSSQEETLQGMQDELTTGEVDAMYTTTSSAGRSTNSIGTKLVLLNWVLQLGHEFVCLFLI